MANTFIQLNDTPSEYTGNVQYLITAGNQIDFVTLSTNELIDVNTLGAYAPTNGQVLQWFGGAEEFRPVNNDPYSAGNGLNISAGTINITALGGGGLAANTSGIFIEPISNVAGTYGNATHIPNIVVNDKGQITSVTLADGSFGEATSLAASYTGNVLGTSGQISVVGGTGINSNATVGLVATGVTAGTYGNATYSPIITVDTYGRIQNVDLVQNIGGGGGNGNVDLSTVTTEAFKSIVVAGQTTVSADTKDDTLTFVAGTGMQITTTAGTDTITFSSTATGGGGASVTVSDSAPVGPSDGDLWWDSTTGKLKIYYNDGSSAQWVDASPASGSVADYSDGSLVLPTSGTPSTEEGSITWDGTADILYVGDGTSAVAITGGGSSYGNADVQSYLDAQGYSNVDSDSQTLTWDAANVNLAISGGNDVTLFDQSLDTTDTVTFNQVNTEDVTGANQLILSAGASGITASTNGNQQFNATSGSIFLVTPTVDAQESAFLANTITANALTVNGQAITAYGNTEVQTYLDAQGYSNVDLDAQTLTWDSANSNLSISGGNTVTLTGIGGSLLIDDTATNSVYISPEDLLINTNSGNGVGSKVVFGAVNEVNNFPFNGSFVTSMPGSAGMVYAHSGSAYQLDIFARNQITLDTDGKGGFQITSGNVYYNAGLTGGINSQGHHVFQFDHASPVDVFTLDYADDEARFVIGNVTVNGTNVLQDLTWDSANSNLSISGGNTVTLTGVGGGITAVVDDTTPQLGGNLDINSKYITGALIPDTNNTYDLGTAELKWRDLYLNSGSIYLGDVVLSTVANVLQANVEGTLKNVSFGGDPVVTNSVKPATTNAEAVDGTVTNVTGGDADGINSTGGDLIIDGGVGAIGNGSLKVGTVSTATIDIGGASTTTTINGQTTFTNDARFDTGVEERFSTINAATGTVVHDCDNGHVFRHTAPSADWTANFTNLGLTTSYATTVTLVIDQGVTARIPTAVQIGGVAQTLLWQGGSPPTGTSNGEDVVSFSILNSGGTYTVLGQLVGFS